MKFLLKLVVFISCVAISFILSSEISYLLWIRFEDKFLCYQIFLISFIAVFIFISGMIKEMIRESEI